ncbi:uncharacterized protein LOC115483457 [Drosophila hydei]|uniref:Uncharacterized protein LOC115483457 n=1 Tax=Drosophila hydei TaxID=7224 RepID=A0A6J2SZ04_DROHY|nr:uncharacterized protein LOC115483457 [Drosophila hydei]
MYKLYILAILWPIADAANKPNHLIVTWESFNCDVNHDLIGFYRCFIVEPAKTLLTSEVQYNRDFAKINASLALANIVYNTMIKNSNYPRKCPQLKGFYFYRNINLGENIPLFFPTGDFKAQLNFFMFDLTMINISVSGTATRK